MIGSLHRLVSSGRYVRSRTVVANGPAPRAGAGWDGSPRNPGAVTRTFSKLIAKLALPRVRLHDLRHGHATMLLRQGVRPKIVSERLGHSTIGITLDTYSHVLPGMQEEAAKRIDTALRAAMRKGKRG